MDAGMDVERASWLALKTVTKQWEEEEMDEDDDDWGDDLDSDRADYSDEEYGEEMDVEEQGVRGPTVVASAPVYRLQHPPAGLNLNAGAGLNSNGKRPVSVAVEEEEEAADSEREAQEISALRAAISRRQSAGIPPDATPPRAALRLATPPQEGTPPKRARLELVSAPEAPAPVEDEEEAQRRLPKRRSEDIEAIPTSDGDAKRARVEA